MILAATEEQTRKFLSLFERPEENIDDFASFEPGGIIMFENLVVSQETIQEIWKSRRAAKSKNRKLGET
jgi:hypothetical protein